MKVHQPETRNTYSKLEIDDAIFFEALSTEVANAVSRLQIIVEPRSNDALNTLSIGIVINGKYFDLLNILYANGHNGSLGKIVGKPDVLIPKLTDKDKRQHIIDEVILPLYDLFEYFKGNLETRGLAKIFTASKNIFY